MNLQKSPRSGASGPGARQVVMPPAFVRTTCHSVLSADICFHSGLDRHEGKLDVFQFCPSLISSRRVENNSSYLWCYTSARAVFCWPAMVTSRQARCGTSSRAGQGCAVPVFPLLAPPSLTSVEPVSLWYPLVPRKSLPLLAFTTGLTFFVVSQHVEQRKR